MDFVKKHWLYLTLGVVAAASIGTAAWAYMAGDSIVEEMNKIDRLRSEIQRESSNPQNKATIEAQKAAHEALVAKQDSLLNAALKPQKYNQFEGRDRQCLVPDALPKPVSDGARYAFKEAYIKAYNELYRRFHGGPGATADDIANEQRIEDAKAAGGDQVNLGPWAPRRPKASEDEGAAQSGEKKSITEILRGYPRARAVEKKAREVYIYVDDGALQMSPIVTDSKPPATNDIWYAQMTLWIQQDIVEALARVNDKRADALKADGRAYDCWVAHMPVKHLKTLASEAWLGKNDGGMGRPRISSSFTNLSLTNDATKFVVPMQIRLVVEESAVMDVLDSICRVGYYTPTSVNYERVQTSPVQDDYIYGNEPVVEVLIDIEGYYFRRVFDAWIPQDLAKPLMNPKGEQDRNRG